MDMQMICRKLELESPPKDALRKAKELIRLCSARFNAASLGISEYAKSVICLELAYSMLQISFDRQKAIRASAMSEKAYVRSFIAMKNVLGVRPRLDMRQLAIHFGCARLVESAQRTLALHKKRFIEGLPAARRAGVDFDRPVFTAVAFFLTSRKSKLKVDHSSLLKMCGASEQEFASVKASMVDLCFDVIGVTKRKRNPDDVKSNRDLLDSQERKIHQQDVESDSDEDETIGKDVDEEACDLIPEMKRPRKVAIKRDYNEWKTSVMEAKAVIAQAAGAAGASTRHSKQSALPFAPAPPGESV